MGITVKPSKVTVTLADDTLSQVVGTSALQFRLGRCIERVTFYVVDLPGQWDVILGQSWLAPHRATIEYSNNSLRF